VTASFQARANHAYTVVVDGFEGANRKVMELGNGGTTLAVVEISGRRLRAYHVGDSAAMVVGRKGRIKHSTIAHSPTGANAPSHSTISRSE